MIELLSYIEDLQKEEDPDVLCVSDFVFFVLLDLNKLQRMFR